MQAVNQRNTIAFTGGPGARVLAIAMLLLTTAGCDKERKDRGANAGGGPVVVVVVAGGSERLDRARPGQPCGAGGGALGGPPRRVGGGRAAVRDDAGPAARRDADDGERDARAAGPVEGGPERRPGAMGGGGGHAGGRAGAVAGWAGNPRAAAADAVHDRDGRHERRGRRCRPCDLAHQRRRPRADVSTGIALDPQRGDAVVARPPARWCKGDIPRPPLSQTHLFILVIRTHRRAKSGPTHSSPPDAPVCLARPCQSGVRRVPAAGG
jgi:hypothetical protein